MALWSQNPLWAIENQINGWRSTPSNLLQPVQSVKMELFYFYHVPIPRSKKYENQFYWAFQLNLVKNLNEVTISMKSGRNGEKKIMQTMVLDLYETLFHHVRPHRIESCITHIKTDSLTESSRENLSNELSKRWLLIWYGHQLSISCIRIQSICQINHD